MLMAVFDSCAVDPLVDEPDVRSVLTEAVEGGSLRVLYTHITLDELANVREPRRTELCEAISELGTQVPTGAFVLGESRLGLARLSDETAVFDTLTTGRRKHARDALIAMTARYENAVLVTQERRRLPRDAATAGIRVMSVSGLVRELGL